MLTNYPGGSPSSAVWIDLFDPTEEERAQASAHCGIEVPSRSALEEIEASSRLRAKGETCGPGLLDAACETSHAAISRGTGNPGKNRHLQPQGRISPHRPVGAVARVAGTPTGSDDTCLTAAGM